MSDVVWVYRLDVSFPDVKTFVILFSYVLCRLYADILPLFACPCIHVEFVFGRTAYETCQSRFQLKNKIGVVICKVKIRRRHVLVGPVGFEPTTKAL